MSDLTGKRLIEFVGEQDEISVRLNDGDTYYAGGLLCFDADGLAAVPADTAASFPAGINTGVYNDGDRVDEKVVASSAEVHAVVKRGKVWLPFTGAVQSDVGEIFYIADDQTLTQTAGSKTVGLVALAYKAGYLLFDLRYADRIA